MLEELFPQKPMKGMPKHLAHTMIHTSLIALKTIQSMGSTVTRAKEYGQEEKQRTLATLSLAHGEILNFIKRVDKTQKDQGRDINGYTCGHCKKHVADLYATRKDAKVCGGGQQDIANAILNILNKINTEKKTHEQKQQKIGDEGSDQEGGQGEGSEEQKPRWKTDFFN